MGITKKYIKSIRAFFFTLLAKRQIKKYGTRLVVNHYSQFIGDILSVTTVISMDSNLMVAN